MSKETFPMINNQHLVAIGEMIVQSLDVALTAENIVKMHQTPEGAEILRLIVRDDLGGAASTIAAALWHNN
jgi:hypothetical protein